jgi:predicted metal-binding membrane protein
MHAHSVAPVSVAASTAMWFAMMAAMMAPTVWPWVRSFSRFGGGSPVWFASGYLVSWLGYSMAAAAVQRLVHMPAATAPVVLAGAGLYQFAPLKRACLAHCRNPFSFFLVQWRNGPTGGFRMGIDHGLYCVGCCWALMATMLVVGMTNVWWMLALAAANFVEQVMPHGDKLRVPVGVALIVIASRVYWRVF